MSCCCPNMLNTPKTVSLLLDFCRFAMGCCVQFDSALRDRFELYAQCRAAGSIDTMRVHQVASGSFRRLRRLMTSSMMSSASSSSSSSAAAYNPQYKVPRVVRDRACLDLLVAASVRPSLHDE